MYLLYIKWLKNLNKVKKGENMNILIQILIVLASIILLSVGGFIIFTLITEIINQVKKKLGK